MYTNDDKDQNYQLSTTYNEENDETEDTIDTAKKSQSATEQSEKDPFSSISAVPIFATKATVFPISQVPASLS